METLADLTLFDNLCNNYCTCDVWNQVKLDLHKVLPKSPQSGVAGIIQRIFSNQNPHEVPGDKMTPYLVAIIHGILGREYHLSRNFVNEVMEFIQNPESESDSDALPEIVLFLANRALNQSESQEVSGLDKPAEKKESNLEGSSNRIEDTNKSVSDINEEKKIDDEVPQSRSTEPPIEDSTQFTNVISSDDAAEGSASTQPLSEDSLLRGVQADKPKLESWLTQVVTEQGKQRNLSPSVWCEMNDGKFVVNSPVLNNYLNQLRDYYQRYVTNIAKTMHRFYVTEYHEFQTSIQQQIAKIADQSQLTTKK